MGNSSSSGRGHHEDTVDFGYLTPQGIYTGPRDWNQSIVTQLIIDRRLAPFYRPLEDYEDSWDDEQILAAMKEPQQPEGPDGEPTITRADSMHSSMSSRSHHKRPSAASKELARHPEVAVYRGAVECPICFLYYPPNINHSRCCDQAICTECFVQIKRADPTTTHLVSEPASCPYCVQESFGVTYASPSWRTGIGSEGSTPPTWSDVRAAPSPESAAKRRRKSFGADSPEVVTIDQIRPDWEAKLAAIRAAVARRANRRIIMRQVGDRLIPVGISSGRVHALPAEDMPEGSEPAGERGSRRSRRRGGQNNELNQYLGGMGLAGQDLEELMVMEAMRLSLLEHEEQQRKQQEEEGKKKKDTGSATAASDTEGAGSVAAASTQAADTTPNAQPRSSSSTDSSPTLLTPDAPTTPSSSNNPGHRSSSSLSRNSAQLSPDSSESWRRQRSPSPLGVIGAALRSATSTASAVGSPSPDEGPSANAAAGAGTTMSPRDSVIGSNVPSSQSVNSSADATTSPSLAALATNGIQTEVGPSSAASSAASVETVGILSPPQDPVGVSSPLLDDHTAVQSAVQSPEPPARTPIALHGSPRPLSMRSASFASSMVSSDQGTSVNAYDYLPSSPASSASSLANKPLLDESPNIPPQSVSTPEDLNMMLGA